MHLYREKEFNSDRETVFVKIKHRTYFFAIATKKVMQWQGKIVLLKITNEGYEKPRS